MSMNMYSFKNSQIIIEKRYVYVILLLYRKYEEIIN